jgi:hypothetical protein
MKSQGTTRPNSKPPSVQRLNKSQTSATLVKTSSSATSVSKFHANTIPKKVKMSTPTPSDRQQRKRTPRRNTESLKSNSGQVPSSVDVQSLKSMGNSPDIENSTEPLLHIAVSKNQARIVQFLLERGLSPNIKVTGYEAAVIVSSSQDFCEIT